MPWKTQITWKSPWFALILFPIKWPLKWWHVSKVFENCWRWQIIWTNLFWVTQIPCDSRLIILNSYYWSKYYRKKTCLFSREHTRRVYHKLLCDAFHDFLSFLQFKKRENTHGGVLLLVKWRLHGGVLLSLKLRTKACNFTKSKTLPSVFFTFFKLYKWYKIVQSITFGIWFAIFLF